MAIRDFLGTDDGEWAVVNGDFAFAEDQVAVVQGMRIRAGMFLGECYLNEDIGVDWLGKILIKGADPLVVRAEIQRNLAETPDVTNIAAADLIQELGSRDASITYLADSVYSTEPFTASIEVPG